MMKEDNLIFNLAGQLGAPITRVSAEYYFISRKCSQYHLEIPKTARLLYFHESYLQLLIIASEDYPITIQAVIQGILSKYFLLTAFVHCWRN